MTLIQLMSVQVCKNLACFRQEILRKTAKMSVMIGNSAEFQTVYRLNRSYHCANMFSATIRIFNAVQMSSFGLRMGPNCSFICTS